MGRIKTYLESKGIHPSDIPGAIIMFKVTGWALYGAMLVSCYKFKPLQRFFKLPLPKQWLDGIKTKYPEKYNKYHSFVMDKSQKLSEWRFFKPIPTTLGLKSKRFVVSLAETTVLYKLLFPITGPALLYGTIKFYQHKNHAEHAQ